MLNSPTNLVPIVLLTATLFAFATQSQDISRTEKIRFSNNSGTPINQDYFAAGQGKQAKGFLYKVENAHMDDRMWDNFKKGHYKYALDDLDYTLVRFPNHPTALMAVASIAKLTNNPTLPMRYFEHALKVYPQYAFTHAQYGSFLADIDSLVDGIKELQEAIRRDPDLGQAHAWLSDAYHKSGEMEKAQESGKRARELGFTRRLKVAP